ncbi:FAD/NAD(P)-binding domain-containing protein [Tilletiaria anomala UBC 951]|uniref:FAD/NAD(P)-binding domain-containing protein n=1 Tax=Tilletiaria anomala (strain ATCC 24038 / CBS 436.72 / UBC 951) TaxID=1037660 RepID=A0A066W619_TILAU|nr:FAD/NAD(P)-binding domain-containing protein [Tilletiaria anomala UBC 951]KDN47983.1 FAD/NAD(P)-binding domain-containing protein [Tilletiaria anomala UBC 951]
MARPPDQRQKLDRTHYSALLLGTDLPTSILSAALARSGRDVLHIDPNDYYGGEWAGLTLSQLVEWGRRRAEKHAKGKQKACDAVYIDFPYSTASATQDRQNQLPEDLLKLDRHYSLAVTPTLLASQGPSIDALIRSKVSSYATFRLLEETAIFVPRSAQDGEIETGVAYGLQHVPSSKEDIFKDRSLSLIEKRKLMKFLQSVMELEKEAQNQVAAIIQPANPQDLALPYDEYLKARFGLSANLIHALAYGISMLPAAPSGLSSRPPITARPALDRARRHLGSIGRYGNSAYLVGQYGGAGELAQGYCRASAVHGSTFMLDVTVENLSRQHQPPDHPIEGARPCWGIEVDVVEGPVSADWVVASQELHHRMREDGVDQDDSVAGSRIARGIVILDRSIPFRKPAASSKEQSPQQYAESSSATDSTASTSLSANDKPAAIETGLLVFPPGSVENGSSSQAVQVLMMGEGTFSCPKGQYVYYLNMELPPDSEGPSISPRQHLEPYVQQLLRMARASSEAEWTPSIEKSQNQGECHPLFSMFYSQKSISHQPPAHDLANENSEHRIKVDFPPPAPSSIAPEYDLPPSLADYTDRATMQAESIFWRIVAGSARDTDRPPETQTPEAFKRRAAEKDRRRRKRRSPEDFQGRAGAFPHEENSEQVEGGDIEGYAWDDVVEFFEPPEAHSLEDE